MNRVKQNIISKEEQDQIVISNTTMVRQEAFKFARKFTGTGLTIADFISAGNVGLVEGAKRYDPSKGKASNYVRWWIKAKMIATAYERKSIHVPWNKINKIIAAQKIDDVNNLSFQIPQVISLNKNVGSSDGERSTDSLEFESMSISGGGFDNYAKKELKDHIEYTLNNCSLSSIEKDTIIHRFGLLGNEPKTLAEVALLKGYSAMGIMKAEKRAFNKLKKSNLIKDII